MNSPYDWAKETEWTSAPEPNPPVYDWTDDAMRTANMVVRTRRSTPPVNAVTGHGVDCRCSKCPGWYDDRAAKAAGVPRVAPAPRTSRPLTDVVLPVAVLMCVFTMCMAVLLPILTPLVALSALSLGLVAVSIAVIAVVGLVLAGMVRRTARETGEIRVVRGRVVKR